MSRTLVYLLGGIALVGSAVVSLLGGMLHPVVDGRAHSVAALTAPLSGWAQIAIWVGSLLLMIGLPAAFFWLAPHLRWWGVVGFVLYFVGNSLSAQSHLVVEGFVAIGLAERAPELIAANDGIVDVAAFQLLQTVGGLVFVAGLLLTGIGLATVRDGVLPRWVGVPGIVGGLLLFAPVPMAPLLTGLIIELPRGLTVALVGIALIRAMRRTPAPATTAAHPVAA